MAREGIRYWRAVGDLASTSSRISSTSVGPCPQPFWEKQASHGTPAAAPENESGERLVEVIVQRMNEPSKKPSPTAITILSNPGTMKGWLNTALPI